MFPSGSPPAFTTAQTSHGICTWLWRWERQVALTPSRQIELKGLPHFQPRKELQGSHETQPGQMEQLFLEQLQCQHSVLPRDPLDSSSFGIMCVEGKLKTKIPTGSLSDDSVWCTFAMLHWGRLIYPCREDRSKLPSDFLKIHPYHLSYFRINSEFAKVASNIWLRLGWQISPRNQEGQRETVLRHDWLVEVKASLLHTPQAMLSALGSVLTRSDKG